MKGLRVGRLRPVFKPKKYTTVVAFLIVGAGIASALFAGISSHLQQREYLVGRAQTISDTLPIQDIQSLKSNQSDLNTAAYARVKKSLQQVSNSNTDISRIHLFVIRDGKLQVAADSKTPDAAGYISPGSGFSEASESLRTTFKTNAPRYDNLTSDYAGSWIAAYTPVFDVQTGKTIGAVGVFKDARTYYLEVLLFALVPLLLAAIPLAGILRDIKIQAKEHEIMQLKNEFVSIASHELRSPLTGMLWAIQNLSQNAKKLNPKHKDLLDDMYKSTESSLVTVNEILDLSIFERGQADKLQHDKLDVIILIKQVVSTLALGAQEKNITVKTSKDWPESAYIIGDVGAIKRAFMNIMSNAIKYSPADATIEVGYRVNDQKQHIISIKDHGIGIPADEQQKVLEGYYRASNASSVQAHGTGLGLWVSKQIVEQNGGRLWINSKVDHGTTVFIALSATTD